MNKLYPVITIMLFFMTDTALAKVVFYSRETPNSICGETRIRSPRMTDNSEEHRKKWEDYHNMYDEFTKEVLVFMRDNNGFAYLDKTNNPKGEITALPAYRMVEFSSKNCKTFLESNKLLIYSAITKNNLVKNARKSIDVTDYLINLLVQLYGYGERNRVVDIISEIFSNQPKIKEKLHDEF